MSGWGRIDRHHPEEIVPLTEWTPTPGYEDFGLLSHGPDVPVLFAVLYGLPILGYDTQVVAHVQGCRN